MRLCLVFQTTQGAKRSVNELTFFHNRNEKKKTDLSSDGTAAATRERLNLHMVGAYLK